MRIYSWPLWKFCYTVTAWIALTARYRLKFVGDRKLQAPALILGKHASYWDVPALARVSRRVFPCVPFFEMGSFHGYPVLGRIIWLLKQIGGFPVMRPKDLMRLKHQNKLSSAEAKAVMQQVNGDAAERRREILRRGHVVCYFPEGTRSKEQVMRLRSRHEIEEAQELIKSEGLEVFVLPVIPVYGAKPKVFFPWVSRAELTLHVLDPVSIADRDVDEVLELVGEGMRETWTPTPQVS